MKLYILILVNKTRGQVYQGLVGNIFHLDKGELRKTALSLGLDAVVQRAVYSCDSYFVTLKGDAKDTKQHAKDDNAEKMKESRTIEAQPFLWASYVRNVWFFFSLPYF